MRYLRQILTILRMTVQTSFQTSFQTPVQTPVQTLFRTPFPLLLPMFFLMLTLTLILTPAMALSIPEEQPAELIYEAEDWSEPKEAVLLNRPGAENWQIWTKEDGVERKRSRGASVTSPVLPDTDREKPEDGAPVLHTRITGIPKGTYQVFMNPPNRPLALSFDGGKTWQKTVSGGEVCFGIYTIEDGVFELWLDDRYASDGSKGWAYYDYIRFMPFAGTLPEIQDIQAFVPPFAEETVRISWLTSEPSPFTASVTVTPKDGSASSVTVQETDSGLRNHSVTLENLEPGREYTAEVFTFLNRSGGKLSQQIPFRAGKKRAETMTQKMNVALTVAEPTEFARQNWPVTSGVPFARGVLASEENVCLKDADGKTVEAHFTPAAYWPDGTIQWLTVDFLADTCVPNTPNTQNTAPTRFTLVLDPGFKAPEKKREKKNLTCDDVVAEITFADGLTRYASVSDSELMYDSVKVEQRQSGCFTETPDSDSDSKSDSNSESNVPGFRWRMESTSWKGTGLKRLRLTLGNARTEEPFTLLKSAVFRCEFAGGSPLSFRAFQDLPDHAAVEENGQKKDSERFDGYVEFRQGQNAVLLNHFWQFWPKSLNVTQDAEKTRFEFGILPELPENYGTDPKQNERDTLIQSYYWLEKGGFYRFKRGMELTTEFWTADGRGDDPHLREHLQHPLFAACTPEYYCASGVFSHVNPVRPGVFEDYEDAFRKSWENHLRGRENRGEYGWMNFGDWFGERTNNWGNNEYDLSFLCALHFARSGDLNLLWRGVEMAQHYSTVDFRRYPWKNRDRERMYEHCFGHVNGFFDPADPRLEGLKGQAATVPWWFKSESDGSGGHDTQAGNFYIGCLTGDSKLLETARTACTAQAMYMTPEFRFSIERAVGWAIINAAAAYRFTNDPVYLNAARIYFEKVEATQNPETGCFDLPQDQNECDCPDKKEHRGGKAFATGMLLHGLARYYEQEPDPARRERIKTVMVRCSEWLLNCAWNEEKQGFRYKTGCPKYADTARPTVLVLDGLAETSAISGNSKYVDFVVRTSADSLKGVSGEGGGSGKDFSQKFRQTPYALYWVEALTGKKKLE